MTGVLRRAVRIWVVPVVLVLATACADQGQPESAGDEVIATATPDPTATGSVPPSTPPGGGSGSPGRLVTVILPENASLPDAGLIDGTFRVGDKCITWEPHPGRQILLIWPAGYTEFDAASATVRLTSIVTGETVAISDGQRVSLGGQPVSRTPPPPPSGTALARTHPATASRSS